MPTLNPSDTTCDSSFNPGGGFAQQYYGNNCTGGELSGLFNTDLGNKANESVLDQAGDIAEQIANLALFRNVQGSVYWSGTEYAPITSIAWTFTTYNGYKFYNNKNAEMPAMAVRAGDVAASVPEPQTLALALLALGAAVAARRRRPV